MNIVLGYLVLFLIVAKCHCCSVNGCNKISLQYSHSEDNYLQAIKCYHWCLKQVLTDNNSLLLFFFYDTSVHFLKYQVELPVS